MLNNVSNHFFSLILNLFRHLTAYKERKQKRTKNEDDAKPKDKVAFGEVAQDIPHFTALPKRKVSYVTNAAAARCHLTLRS